MIVFQTGSDQKNIPSSSKRTPKITPSNPDSADKDYFWVRMEHHNVVSNNTNKLPVKVFRTIHNSCLNDSCLGYSGVSTGSHLGSNMAGLPREPTGTEQTTTLIQYP